MQKKKLYIALNIILCCSAAIGASAQVTVTIPAANITSQTDYSVIGTNGTANAALLSSITVSSTTANLPATTSGTASPLPLTPIYIQGNTVASLALGSTSEVNLSTSPQSIAYAVIALSGAFTVKYRMAIATTAWLAGSYSTNLTFTNVTPAVQPLTIIVPAILTLGTPVTTTSTLTVSSLAAFRTGGGVSVANTFNYQTTVPTIITLKASSNPFSFTTSQLFNSTPAVDASQLSAVLSGTNGSGSAINLSTTDQAISIASVPVVVTNATGTLTSTLSISAANLKSSFAQAGTYTLPLVYTVAKTSAAYPATLASGTMNTSVQLTIPKLFELTIPTTTVNLNFNTAAAYAQGVTAIASNPVMASSTVPYSVTVTGNGNFTSGGNTIPIGVMIVEGATGQTGVASLPLTNAAQSLITSANPVIDRAINLQFRIPSTQTSNLLNKPAGTYSTSVTFTIVAP